MNYDDFLQSLKMEDENLYQQYIQQKDKGFSRNRKAILADMNNNNIYRNFTNMDLNNNNNRQIMKLNDHRTVLYISYLYVSSKYRSLGLGATLLNMAIQRASLLNLNSVVLIVDTENQKVLDFYMKKGFIYDQQLRRYDRYDILS